MPVSVQLVRDPLVWTKSAPAASGQETQLANLQFMIVKIR